MLAALTWYYSLIDRHAEAVNIGQQAVKLSPNNYAAHTNLCRAYNDTKLYQQAIEACNRALALQPNDGETNLYLARAHDFQTSRMWRRSITKSG
jgi:tetratricopeptide (TPR) repeat protein